METYTLLPKTNKIKKNKKQKTKTKKKQINKQKQKQKHKKQTKRYCVTFLDHLVCVFIHTVLY